MFGQLTKTGWFENRGGKFKVIPVAVATKMNGPGSSSGNIHKLVFNGHNVKVAVTVTTGWTGVIMVTWAFIVFTIPVRTTTIHLTRDFGLMSGMIYIFNEMIHSQKQQATDQYAGHKFHHRYNNNKKVRIIVLKPEI
jgi:hypothetical protein